MYKIAVEGARYVPAKNEEEKCDRCGFGKYITKTKCCQKKICETCMRIYNSDYLECAKCMETEEKIVGKNKLWFRKNTVIYCIEHSDGKIDECEQCNSTFCAEHKVFSKEDDKICKYCRNGDIILLDPPFLTSIKDSQSIETFFAAHVVDSYN